jgi:hypothetical protein
MQRVVPRNAIDAVDQVISAIAEGDVSTTAQEQLVCPRTRVQAIIARPSGESVEELPGTAFEDVTALGTVNLVEALPAEHAVVTCSGEELVVSRTAPQAIVRRPAEDAIVAGTSVVEVRAVVDIVHEDEIVPWSPKVPIRSLPASDLVLAESTGELVSPESPVQLVVARTSADPVIPLPRVEDGADDVVAAASDDDVIIRRAR